MKSRGKSPSLGYFEPLETRQLLAIDLVVEHDAFAPANPGAEVTRVARVHNLGDEVAEQALVRSSLSDELLDATWQRTEDRAKFIADPTAGREPDFAITENPSLGSGSFGAGVRLIGDVNGDGHEDYLVQRQQNATLNADVRVGDSFIVLDSLETRLDLSDPTAAAAVIVDSSTERQYRFDVFTRLGDINGDGFDDLAAGGNVIFGHADFGSGTEIDIASLTPGRGTSLTFGSNAIFKIHPVGDINQDGFADFATGFYSGTPRLILGHETFGSETNVNLHQIADEHVVHLSCNAPGTDCPTSWFHSYDASPVGDVNGDGFNDAIIGLGGVGSLVVYGSPNLGGATLHTNAMGENGFLIPATTREHLGFDITSEITVRVRYDRGGDFDGDGYADLLITMQGNDCQGCTATDKSNFDSNGGAIVVFGGPEIATDGQFNANGARTLRMGMTVSHYDRRPSATTSDVNNDGRPDIVLSTSAVSYVIQDVTTVTDDMDFGFSGPYWTEQSRLLNGQNGFGQLGDRAYVDVNRDGLVDEVLFRGGTHARVFLASAANATTSGAGDINETLDIEPGTSLVYTVTGIVRDDATAISSAAVAAEARGSDDLRDNLDSDYSGILLNVEVAPIETANSLDDVVAGDEVEFEFRIANDGPADAIDVVITEDISASLQDVTWTRSETVFPRNLELEKLNGADGASFTGPTRIYAERRITPGYDTPLFGGLGQRVGSLGDTNGDGSDEFYGVGTAEGRFGFFQSDERAMTFLGGPDFGSDGNFPTYAEIITPPSSPAVPTGDFNGDGFLDRFEGDSTTNESRGETRITFGTAEGIPDVPASELNGENGFVISGSLSGDRTGYSIAVGDVNHDGYDDVIVARGRDNYLDDYDEFYPTSDPAIYVVYGHANGHEHISLGNFDAVKGFQITTPGKVNSVVSDLDVNGDGIDDIVIGDPAAGIGVDYGLPIMHGGLYVVYGRQETSASGLGPIEQTVDIPRGGEVTFTVRGTVPQDATAGITGSFTATPQQQIDLDPRSNEAHVDVPVTPASIPGFPQTPEFIERLATCGPYEVRNEGSHDVAYFSGNDAESGCATRLDYEGMWRTDGTREGTYPLGRELGEIPHADSIVEFEGDLYFRVTTAGYGWDVIYKSDGSPNSAELIGQYQSIQHDAMFVLGDTLIHWDWDPARISMPSRLMATQAGQQTVLMETESLELWSLRQLGEHVVFATNEGVYRTDGTPAGTVLLHDADRIELLPQVSLDSQHFWQATDNHWQLGVTNGTEVQIIDDARVDFADSNRISPSFAVGDGLYTVGTNGELLFVDHDQVTTLVENVGAIEFGDQWNERSVLETTNRIFVTDGTPEGTERISIRGAVVEPHRGRRQMYVTTDFLYFATSTGLYRSDGTTDGTRYIDRSEVEVLAATDDFAVWNSSPRANGDARSLEMLASDETMNRDFDDIGIEPRDYFPIHIQLEDGSVLISGTPEDDPNGRVAFWRTDGTREGTAFLSYYQAPFLVPSAGDGFLRPLNLDGNANFLEINDRIIYSAWHLGPSAMYTIENRALDPLEPVDDILAAADEFGGDDPTTDVDVADLDGDGDLDIFESITGVGDRVWLNDGNAQFAAPETNLDAYQSIYSALGDVDGDGDIDAVTATYDRGTVLAINDGTGSFSSDYRIANEPNSDPQLRYRDHDIALGDLDGDGDLDIYVAAFTRPNPFGGQVVPAQDRVYLNDGSGNFSDGNSAGIIPASTTSVELADVDNDGDLDAVTSARTVRGSRILLNDGNGNFESGQSLNAAEHHTFVDADGDGDVDIIGAEDGANRIWLNDGSGSFTHGQRIGTSLTSQIVAADFDQDGDMDLIAGNWRGDGNEVWLNDGRGNFQPQATSLDVEMGTDHLAVGDLDSDGDLDAIAGVFRDTNRIYTNSIATPSLLGDLNGDNEVGFDDFLALSRFFGSTDATPEQGDLNEDGTVDFSDFLVFSRNFGRTL